KCHTAGSPGNRATRRFIVAAVALTAIFLIPPRPRPAAAQDDSRHGWKRDVVGDKDPAGTPGSNTPRGEPTPAQKCDEDARRLRAERDAISEAYYEAIHTGDSKAQAELSDQWRSLLNKWAALQGRCTMVSNP